MKKTIIATINITLVALGWFVLSWLFFNSMDLSAQESVAAGIASTYGGNVTGGFRATPP